MGGGDDFEDDYVADDDIPIVSDQEGESFEELELFKVDKQDAAPASVSKKRKRREKEKEKRQKRKLVVDSHRDPTEDSSPLSAQLSSPEAAAAYLFFHQKNVFNKLSHLELEDLKIPEECVLDTTLYTGPRALDNLGEFIDQAVPKLMTRLKQQPKFNGAPTLIFVAGAALRVADVTRVLRKFRGEKGGDVAKLFAKHMKLQDQITYLRRTKVGVAAGTPGRLGQLLEAEALALPALTHIFLDVSTRDAKKRSLFDIPEIRDEVFRGILNREGILTGLRSGKIKVVLF